MDSLTIKTKQWRRDELRAAIKRASDALNAYWDAERDIEVLVGVDIDDLREAWIEPHAVSGMEISDASLNLFIEHIESLIADENKESHS